jgi:hypothetical protein
MVLVGGSAGRGDPEAAGFSRIVDAMSDLETRPEVSLDQVPAPTRLASYGVALSADVLDGDEELGSGRFVLLYEPGGHEAWDGDYRCVTFVRACVERDVADDPMLPAVGWSWLREALEAHGVSLRSLGGTVTAVVNESFGTMAGDAAGAEVEVRASWTPVVPDDQAPEAEMARHARAWVDLLCTSAGLAPLPEGVVALPRPRSRT